MSKKTVEIEECYGGVEWRGPEFVTAPFKSKRKKKRPVWLAHKNMFGHVNDDIVQAEYKEPKNPYVKIPKKLSVDIDDGYDGYVITHEIPVLLPAHEPYALAIGPEVKSQTKRRKLVEPVKPMQPQVNLFARREINFNED